MATIFFGNAPDVYTPPEDAPNENDEFHGGFGDDILTADNPDAIGGGSDRLFGDQGADRLFGGYFSDTIYGGNGRDLLYGDYASNLGSEGDDLLIGGAGADTIFGGGGTDTADYSGSGGAVVVRIGQISEGGDAQGDEVAPDVENIRGSAFADELSGSSLGNLLEGLAGDDRLFGQEGDDTFYAGDGEFDYMVGGAGADGFYGGGGARDTASYLGNATGVAITIGSGTGVGGDAAGDFIALSVEDVWGSDGGDDVLYGSSFDNTLRGYGGNDYLWGRGGGDRLTGGEGNDNLLGDQGGDTIEGGQGIDTAIFLTGVAVDLQSPGLNSGEAAGDSFFSVENLIGSGAADVLSGDDAANVFQGGDGGDRLLGRAGNDRLDGQAGIDSLEGGAGDDVYVLNDANAAGSLTIFRYDSVIESSGGGIDAILVNSDADTTSFIPGYTLTENVENATITGAADFRLIGNGGDNTLEGNDAANSLNGLEGDDSLNGQFGGDTLTGGAGNDFYRLDDVFRPHPLSAFQYDSIVEAVGGGASDWVAVTTGIGRFGYTMTDNVEIGSLLGDSAFVLTGNAIGNSLRGNVAANTLSGLDGNDGLNGSLGADELRGGRGNDRYFLYDVSGASSISAGAYDRVVEGAGAGIDTVIVAQAGTHLSYTLGANIENGIVSGNTAFGLNGNGLGNTLSGQNGANVLSGLAGNDVLQGLGGADVLRGGLGRDTLDGGGGSDVFDFNSVAESSPAAAARDDIVAFTHLVDRIDLATIDANTAQAGNQQFAFIGTAAFSAAGQVRIVQSGADALLELNITGTTGAEARILIESFTAATMTAVDLVL